MVPPTRAACLDHIRRILFASTMELSEFAIVGDHSTMSWESRSEDVRDQHQVVFGADRTHRFDASSHAARSAHQLRMGIAHILTAETTASKFVDDGAPSHPVIDEARAK